MGRPYGGGEGRTTVPAENPIGLLPCDAVCRQSSLCLETGENFRCFPGEAPVDIPRAQTERDELELERRHVPTEGTDAELALTEERASQRTERGPGCPAEAAAGGQTDPLLEARESGPRQRPVDPVHGRRVVTVSPQRHLEGSNAGVGRCRSEPRKRQGRGSRGRKRQQAEHALCVGTNRESL